MNLESCELGEKTMRSSRLLIGMSSFLLTSSDKPEFDTKSRRRCVQIDYLEYDAKRRQKDADYLEYDAKRRQKDADYLEYDAKRRKRTQAQKKIKNSY